MNFELILFFKSGHADIWFLNRLNERFFSVVCIIRSNHEWRPVIDHYMWSILRFKGSSMCLRPFGTIISVHFLFLPLSPLRRFPWTSSVNQPCSCPVGISTWRVIWYLRWGVEEGSSVVLLGRNFMRVGWVFRPLFCCWALVRWDDAGLRISSNLIIRFSCWLDSVGRSIDKGTGRAW